LSDFQKKSSMKTGNGAFQGSSLWLVNWPNFFGFIFVSAANFIISGRTRISEPADDSKFCLYQKIK